MSQERITEIEKEIGMGIAPINKELVRACEIMSKAKAGGDVSQDAIDFFKWSLQAHRSYVVNLSQASRSTVAYAEKALNHYRRLPRAGASK